MSDCVWCHRRQPTRLLVPGILQARTLEWVAISFSNAWKWKVKVKSLSRAWLLATPWTAAYQAPPSTGFSRQEYWGGCHCLLRFCTILQHEFSLKTWISTGLQFKFSGKFFLTPSTQCQGWEVEASFLSFSVGKFISLLILYLPKL